MNDQDTFVILQLAAEEPDTHALYKRYDALDCAFQCDLPQERLNAIEDELMNVGDKLRWRLQKRGAEIAAILGMELEQMTVLRLLSRFV